MKDITGIGFTSMRPAAQRWREQYNPLRNLTLDRAVALLEAYQRGEMADVQWAYYFLEQTDPDLFALVERRTSAILELDWSIKSAAWRVRPAPDAAPVRPSDATLAAEQTAALHEAYERIDNLYDAIGHLAMASFRGFAHLEKRPDPSGAVRRLEPLDSWNVVRDGLRGPWRYNPEARPAAFRALDPALTLDPARWLMRDVPRHINRIALLKFVRSNLAEKDWSAFVEIYGLPGVVIVGPPGVTAEDAAAFEEQAARVAEGASGYLPNGAAVHFHTGPRLAQPYRDYLRYWSEQLVLAGTGGILTMLTASGTGTLAGSVHAETFRQIARSEARIISEVFQEQLDRPLLEAAFPGRPRLAWFELVANEEVNLGAVVDHAVNLARAGFRIDPGELAERTGYKLSTNSISNPNPNPDNHSASAPNP